MRILHIWDQAGVACILAKHQRKLGHEVRIMKRAGYDPFGIFDFYREPLMHIDGKSFIKNAIVQAEQYEAIHVHSLYKIIPELRKRYPKKKLVLHYHGSEARKETKDSVQYNAEQDSDAVVGSTDDLKPYVGNAMIHVPNPIDTDHFKPGLDSHGSREGAFTFRTTGADVEWVLQYLKDNGIDMPVDVLDRQDYPIPYSLLPRTLARYSLYVDLKHIGGTLLHAPSKTALECLACGLQVLDHSLKYSRDLPDEHRPETVASKVLEIYHKS
jgi:hypothetical protein